VPRRALIEHRPWLLVGIVAALTYYFVWNNPVGGVWLIGLKGIAICSLAIYAVRRADGGDAVMLSGALAIAGVAAMLAELFDATGFALFALFHVLAALLYQKNHRGGLPIGRRLIAAIIGLGTPLAMWLLTGDGFMAGYGAILGWMAAAAWTSRFPRRRNGTGALLLILADLLQLSRMGGFDTGELPEVFVWPLFYAGLILIATGVVQTLRGETGSPNAPTPAS